MNKKNRNENELLNQIRFKLSTKRSNFFALLFSDRGAKFQAPPTKRLVLFTIDLKLHSKSF